MSVRYKPSLANVKAVVFDYGNVLCLPPTTEEIEDSARILGLSTDAFQELWGRNRDLYDRGDLSAERYWRELAEAAGTTLATAQLHELYERDVRMWSRLNPEMLTWLTILSASGMRVAILSNMHLGMVHHARQAFQWLECVHHATFSAEVRLIKPDPEIYACCLQGLGVTPADTLFIDDREDNVLAARALGIHALQFHSIQQLRTDLEQAGFPTLPSHSNSYNPRLA
jgi:putative hydrolase of the HAD superfamily